MIALADREQRIVVTKDADFVNSFLLRNQPARLLLISTGNISNEELLSLFREHWSLLAVWLEAGSFVELAPRMVTLHQ